MPIPIEEIDVFLRDNGMDQIYFHGIDHAWGFREDEPIIGIINKRDGGETFQAAMSLYWASANYITKPWCLLLAINKMAPQQRQTLDNLGKQYNIQVVSEEHLLTTVKEQLKCLTITLRVYVKDSEKPIRALSESVKKWREEKPVTDYQFEVEVETGNLEIYKENGELVPGRKTVPLTASSNQKRIDGILPRLLSVKDGLFFDTEHRNLPMVFKLHIAEPSSLVLRFEADKSNINEATSFWSLYRGFTVTNRLAFIESNTGDTLFSCVRELDDRGTRKSG
jgi:hypothetical protein